MKLKYIIALTAGLILAATMAEAKGNGDRVRDCDRDPVKECTQDCTQDCDQECAQDCEKKQDGTGGKGQKKGDGTGTCQ